MSEQTLIEYYIKKPIQFDICQNTQNQHTENYEI